MMKRESQKSRQVVLLVTKVNDSNGTTTLFGGINLGVLILNAFDFVNLQTSFKRVVSNGFCQDYQVI